MSAASFRDRADAGRALAVRLVGFRGRADLVVLGLARGGVPVAAEVARSLNADLDVIVVAKLGVPGFEELAMGAIAAGEVIEPNEQIRAASGVTSEAFERVAASKRDELVQRERAYRRDHEPLPLAGRIVIVVDDGLATGASMRAAVTAVRRHRPARVVVAVPVGSPRGCDELAVVADEVICAQSPASFHAVGSYYDDFSPTTDADVGRLLASGGGRPPPEERSR